MGNFLIAGVTKSVDRHDSACLTEALDQLVHLADLLELEIQDSNLTLDPAFDSEKTAEEIEKHGLKPIIKPNPRGSKKQETLHEQFERFDEIEDIYRQRYKVERSFAWEDTYRRLVVRYDRLAETHQGFKLLAYSLINLRWFIKDQIL